MNPSPTVDPQHIEQLFAFLRFRSVSTDPACRGEVHACAAWLHEHFSRIGLESRLCETAGHPVVVARTTPHPGKRTVLFYGHYDVQPEEPLSGWTSPPFEPTIREGRIYARGATDDKGQLYAHIAGVADLLKRGAELPVNVIFLVEGEEEIGSPSLPAFLEAHRQFLACDVIVISDSGMVAPGVPTLAYALRGVVGMECIVRGPARDLHSGVYGGAIRNPLAAAARLIASLHDDDGRVAIEGFYDAVRPMEDWERAETAAAPCGDAEILQQTGAPALFGEPGFSSMERIGARPTAEVNGMGGGYQGPGTKTVLPAKAFFKLTFRLVPDQSGQEILDKAEAHLRAHCPSGVTLEIIRGHSGEPYFMNPRSEDGMSAVRAMEAVFGRKACLLREGGSIPILLEFQRILGVDSLLLALGWPDGNGHSPDENLPLENLALGIRLNQRLLEELANGPRHEFRGDVPAQSRDVSSVA